MRRASSPSFWYGLMGQRALLALRVVTSPGTGGRSKGRRLLSRLSTTRSNLVRRQQQTSLGSRDSLDKSDALQRLIEIRETLHAKFDDNVPPAIGGV
jgi:hypothetical protein